jgi:hypothetical protein
MQKSRIYLILLLLMPIIVMGQEYKFTGVIVNSETDIPIENVSLKILNSTSGTTTTNGGKFELIVSKLPVFVEITCIGYQNLSIEINKSESEPIEIVLQPVAMQLEGITVSVKKAMPVFSDQNYTVLDYEIMGDDLLLLVYKYKFERSNLLLITRWGDTLAQTGLPEIPPLKLYKDPLGNVHYFSGKGNAYQCYFDKEGKKLSFIHNFSVEKVQKTFGDIKFEMNKKLFFQENTPEGFSSQIGYFSKEDGKKYLQFENNQKEAKAYYSDLKSFLEPTRPGDVNSMGAKMQAFELFYKPRNNAVMIKAGNDRIVVFDFISDTLELLNSDWKILAASAISFHKEVKENLITTIATSFSGNQWEWKSTIYADEYTGKVYVSFEKQGRIKLCNIDLYSGKIIAEYVLPVLFVEKINIYKGEAFFRYKEIGESEKWKLYKMRL